MVFRINPDNIETFTLETNVNREISGDKNGITTGSLHVIPRRLEGMKEIYPNVTLNSGPFSGDVNIESKRKEIAASGLGSTAMRKAALESYMSDVHQLGTLAKFDATASVYKIQTPPELNIDSQRRLFLQKYIERQPVRFGQESDWSTTNYHCLNFFTSSNTPVSSALIYPNRIALSTSVESSFNPAISPVFNSPLDFLSGSKTSSYKSSYQLFGPFSFDFWIKPKYNANAGTLWNVSSSNYYRPGAILHYSSAYAITLHSGSSKDQNNLTNKFRICFQLGYDADTSPDKLVYGVDSSGSLTGSTFWSSDNVIEQHAWTHVAITYGGHLYDQGTGSIWINGVKDRDINIGAFYPVGTMSLNLDLWGALYVGNYYQGNRQAGQNLAGSSSYDQARFWGINASDTGPWNVENSLLYFQQGLINRNPGTVNDNYFGFTKNKNYWYIPALYFGFSKILYNNQPQGSPLSHSFVYPLNAEVHDIKLWSKRLSVPEIQNLQTRSIIAEDLPNLRFWLPPFYTEESVPRITEPVSPFFSMGTADDPLSSSFPFAARLAMSTNGFYPNLENYLIDLAIDNPPIQWNLRWLPNQPVSSVDELTANQWMYEVQESASCVRKRLYTVIPNDHGNFNPSFNMIKETYHNTTSFVNQYGTTTLGRINLKNSLFTVPNGFGDTSTSEIEAVNLVAQNSMIGLSNDLTSSILNDLYGTRPESVTGTPGNGFAVWHRLQSNDSHHIVMFDISNLYYGESIKPGSVELYTNNMSGSNGAFGMSFVDNKRGGLVRSDTTSTIAEWSTVGTVLYEEGIVIIKYPQLYFFGEEGWTLKFKGTRNVYVFTIEAAANPMTCTESGDPMFDNVQLATQTDYNPNEQDRKQVFIGSVLIHDENLNVVLRGQFAQPVLKKSGDKILVKLKIDY